MKRLNKEQIIDIATEFDEFGFRATNPCGKETNDRIVKDIHKAFNELIELKEIEDELNFDLIILLKALINGIYVVNDGYIEDDKIAGVEKFIDGWGIITYYNQLELCFSEYGDTWALTEEELEVEE